MAKYHGRLGELWLADSGDNLRNLSPDISSVEAPSNADTVDVSGMGDTTKKYVVGLKDSQMRVQGNFNDATNTSHPTLSGVVGGTTALPMHFYPRGSVASAPVFKGSVLCSEYSVSASVSGAVTWSANLVPFDTTAPSWQSA